MDRGLLTTETVAQYRTTLDGITRKITYLQQEMDDLRSIVSTLLDAASTTLEKDRERSSAYNLEQRTDWMSHIVARQQRMMAELDAHILEPWWRVHGRAYYKREQYVDLNGWTLGMHTLVVTGPYPGWRVEMPAHPDKQGPGGDGYLDCSTPSKPCSWVSTGTLKYVEHCPDSDVIAISSRNRNKRRRSIAAWQAKLSVDDCPDTWGLKTSDGAVIPMPNPQSVEGVGLRIRLQGRENTYYIPCRIVRGLE